MNDELLKMNDELLNMLILYDEDTDYFSECWGLDFYD